MIIYFLKDLLFTFLKLYTIIYIYHSFVLDFHCILLLSGKMKTEEDLAKGAFAYEIYYLVTLYHLSGRVANIKKEIIRDCMN